MSEDEAVPVVEKPMEAQPVEAKPVEAKPVEAKPVEAKPVEAKPVEAKPVEAKPVEAKPVEAKPVEAKPVEAKPVEAKPVEAKPVAGKPMGSQSVSQSGETASRLANVESLFSELAAIYGARFADMWRNTDVVRVKTVWANALLGFSVGEVRRGVLRCREKPWPPTLPEFLQLCRPEPDMEGLFGQAQLQAWRRVSGEDAWPDRVLFWAAYAFGFYELKVASWAVAKARWTRIFTEQQALAESLQPVPERRAALPDAGARLADRESAAQHLAALRALLQGRAAEKEKGV